MLVSKKTIVHCLIMFAHDALTNGKKKSTFDLKNAFVNANLILMI